MIAILVPSRKRLEQCKRMIQSVIDTTESNVAIYLGIDNIDEYREAAFLATERVAVHRYELPDGMPTAHKWNLLAEIAMQHPAKKIFMLGSDDIIFSTPKWDKALIESYDLHQGRPHVWALQDSRDENGTPHPICSRSYIEAMDWFVPPYFLHWQIDNWTAQIAKANNCFSHFKDFLLVHDKPSDQGKPDETFLKIRSQGWRERDQWLVAKSPYILNMEKERLANYIRAVTEGNWVA